MFKTFHQYKGFTFLITNGLNRSYSVLFAEKPEMKTSGKTFLEAFINACSLLEDQFQEAKH